MDSKTYGEALYWASSFLTERKKEREAAEYLMMRRLDWKKTELVMELRKPMPVEVREQFEKDIYEFALDKPAQYIIGHEYFYGEKFKVTGDTLIPRPETEELVALILRENEEKEHLTVVDVGTGTGVIAITLKRLKPSWQVIAVDVSEEALKVAKENAASQGLDIDFRLGDLLEPVKDEQVDLIVSNPPYISENEWDEMDESVRKYEPKTALFAENEGLDFYERFVREIPRVLAVDGRVYFEYGYKQGRAIQQMYQAAFPTKKILVHKDLSGHDRMLEMK
ncbi:peptide chain release factor N(5)-glutamine methyltransferase [Vagococcus elongatus]|uniref:Release factor glutamine methyltransferase n=1 Tax=Vagococcus elongatus TaxID=180344 RepID=A0A430AQP8_9ENTE|nr:peptide chain release factor N(5)-glutamine methyltransferase [Vagococcus elongatus]RSU10303.1 protein-(glutamine-N5) methyltransferase, release factor-specific [Vagococcus elongatus]